jgi:hypothetical protein
VRESYGVPSTTATHPETVQMKLSRDEVSVLTFCHSHEMAICLSPKIYREWAKAWDMQSRYPFRPAKKKEFMTIMFEEMPKKEWRGIKK